VKHVEQNIAAASLKLTKAEFDELNRAGWAE
jgi:aryl-alcohol dehydrogenase-like predicted oxidoreductase